MLTIEQKRNIYNNIQNLYNMDFKTWQEVLSMLYNLVSDVDQKFEVFEQKFILLLGDEVTKNIKELYENGMLADIINSKVFKNLNSKIETLTQNVHEEINVTNNRIDNLIVKSGEVIEKDAEVVDGRVGMNGVIYNTLGEHIRDIERGDGINAHSIDLRKLTDTIPKLSNTFLFSSLTLTEGYYLDTQDGVPRQNVEYGYTDFIAVKPNDKFYCTDTNGLYCKYDYNKRLLGGGNLENNSDFIIDSKTYYIRLSIPKNLAELIKFKKYKYCIEANNVVYENSECYSNVEEHIQDVAKGNGIYDFSLSPKKLADSLVKLSNELLFSSITLTEGYYLDPKDGLPRQNVSYGYSDFIAVKPNDKFYCTDTNGLYCKYDYNKRLLGGGNLENNSDFIIDSKTYYIRLSIPKILVELIKFKRYKFFINARNVMRVATYYVDKNGNGDFTSIQEAVNMIQLGGVGTVYINDGEYEEVVECWGKTVNLIGMSKKGCVLFNYNDDYSIPPLEIGRGSVQNMTIKSINKTDSTKATAYGIHIEDNNLYNGNLQIINCRVESGHNYAIGMGLRGGCDVEFNNCELIGRKVYGGLFFHDAINPLYKGEQNISIKNCIISAQDGGFLMRIQSQNVEGSTVNMEFINNIIRTPVSPDYKGMHFVNDKTGESTTKPTDFSILKNFKLSPMSCGNNIDLFNY